MILIMVVASIKYRASYPVPHDARKTPQLHRHSINPFTRSEFCNPLALASVIDDDEVGRSDGGLSAYTFF